MSNLSLQRQRDVATIFFIVGLIGFLVMLGVIVGWKVALLVFFALIFVAGWRLMP